jgi:HSP20 family molecular chaperone IbpA
MKLPLNVVTNDVDGMLSIEADVPGLSLNDLDVNVRGESVTISGKRSGVPFSHVIIIDQQRYDSSSIEALLVNGVLHLTFEKQLAQSSFSVAVTVISGSE